MRYNEGVFTYSNRNYGGKIEQAVYAEMKHVQALTTRVEVLADREAKIINQVGDNQKNIEDAYKQIRYNYAAVCDLNMRLKALEHAPSVAKKKRRVTVCAGGEKVQIVRNY